jgi:DNA repair protein RecO (recombination protein O)
MAHESTEAILLHAFDYQESSRILRLLTRDHGLRSVLARGAKRSAKRFGAALDLFVQGTAELEIKQGRDLDTLNSFDLTRTRAGIGADLSRFNGAAALAELIIRFAQDDTDPDLFDITADALDRVASADGDLARDAAIAGSWRILAALGFEPSLDQCGECQRDIGDEETVLFNHASGGVICERCASRGLAGRRLPPEARVTLRDWLIAERITKNEEPLTPPSAKAHQRLLREFVHEHLTDGRPLKAFDAWAA